jgi:hypothetical protein
LRINQGDGLIFFSTGYTAQDMRDGYRDRPEPTFSHEGVGFGRRPQIRSAKLG